MESEGTEKTSFSSSFSHVILAFTSRSPDDYLYHISFYKIIRHTDDTHSVFELKKDAIQGIFGGKVLGQKQGSF